MGQNIAFVHAGMAVTNLHERASMLHEVVGSESLFETLLHNLKRCRKLDSILIVTSDKECDSSFCELLRSKSIYGEEGPNIEVMRIPSDSPFAFSERNRILDNVMLYRRPLYGLFSAEGFLHFTHDLDVDCAVIMDADSSCFVSPELIDILVEKGGRKGEMVLLSNPPRKIIAASPGKVSELLRKQLSVVRNRIADRRSTVEKEVEYLRSNSRSLGNSDLKKLTAKKTAEAVKQELNPLESLFILRNTEERIESNISEFNGLEKSLLNVTRPCDLRLLRKVLSSIGEGPLDNLFELKGNLVREVSEVWPSYLNIELTNKCGRGCSFCANPILAREHGMMDDGLYRRIIDEAAENVPFVCLSGYGEPTLHPDLIRFIRYTKEKGVLRTAVETNAVELDVKKVDEMFKAGLDFLIINMNVFMNSSNGWEKRLDEFIRLRDGERQKRDGIFPRVILQMINTNSMASRIDYLSARYNFIADKIVILPFDTFGGKVPDDGVIDFTPLKRTCCRKLLNSLFVFWDGTVALCGEFFEGEFPGISLENGTIRSVFEDDKVLQFLCSHLNGRYPKDCLKCRQWYLVDFERERRHTWQSLVLSEFAKRRVEFTEGVFVEGSRLYEDGSYHAALDKWEEILRNDPGNKSVKDKLSDLAEEDSPSSPEGSKTRRREGI